MNLTNYHNTNQQQSATSTMQNNQSCGLNQCQPQGWENWAGRGSDQRRAKVSGCVDGLS